MRDAEEVAREWWESIGGGDVSNARDFANHIRARDAEVRAEGRNVRSIPEGMVWQDYYSPDEVIQIREQVRAETLAGFTEETDDDCFCAVACSPNVIHVRLVGPWEPDTRTREERSADAINALRPLLTEPEPNRDLEDR